MRIVCLLCCMYLLNCVFAENVKKEPYVTEYPCSQQTPENTFTVDTLNKAMTDTM